MLAARQFLSDLLAMVTLDTATTINNVLSYGFDVNEANRVQYAMTMIKRACPD